MIHLMHTLAAAAYNAKNMEHMFETVVAEICTHTGWALGFGYLVDSSSRLRALSSWYRSNPERYANLQRVSTEIDFAKQESLIGKVVRTQRAVFYADIDNESFLRRREAREAGLKSCLAAPVLVNNKPIAIVEFFQDEPEPVQQIAVESVESVAFYLGLVIEHKRLEKKLEALFDSAPDAEIVTDRSGTIVMANEQSVRLFGYEREELLGHPVELLVPMEQREKHVRHRLNFISAPHPRPMGNGVELAALGKDGARIPVEVSLSPIPLEEELLIASAIRDISRRKELEGKLRERERLADIGATAAIFAHEIASPLNGISTTVQLLEMGVSSDLRPLTAELSTEIRRLESLLNQFRSLSRLGDLKPKAVNLAGVIRRVLEINAPHWSGLHIRIDNELCGDLTLTADEEKLHQVVLNLCKNAVEAMTCGGRLSIKAYSRDEEVVLEISDTGCGIPADIDIFQPFTTGKIQGAGLGLHIVHQIVSAHGGAISYQSAQGMGTTFEVSLPKNLQGTGKP